MENDLNDLKSLISEIINFPIPNDEKINLLLNLSHEKTLFAEILPLNIFNILKNNDNADNKIISIKNLINIETCSIEILDENENTDMAISEINSDSSSSMIISTDNEQINEINMIE